MRSARNEKYRFMFKMSVSKEMQYRVNFLVSMVSAIIPMGMAVFMWKAVYRETEALYGYNYTQMILYTIRFLYFLGGKLVSISVNGITLVGVLWWFHRYTNVHISLLSLLFFVIVTILAILLNYIIFLTVGLTAFWLVDTLYLFWAISLIIQLASGGVLPLEVFGSVGKVLLQYLPFQYTAYIPIHIILGTLSVPEMLQSIGIQLFWIGVLGVLARYVWSKGIKNYVSVGG